MKEARDGGFLALRQFLVRLKVSFEAQRNEVPAEMCKLPEILPL